MFFFPWGPFPGYYLPFSPCPGFSVLHTGFYFPPFTVFLASVSFPSSLLTSCRPTELLTSDTKYRGGWWHNPVCELVWQTSQGENSPMPSITGRTEVLEIGSFFCRNRKKEEWWLGGVNILGWKKRQGSAWEMLENIQELSCVPSP